MSGILTALLAGCLGGALVGLAESTLIVSTSGASEEHWLFLFGLAAYGLLGACIGSGWGILTAIIGWGRRRPAVVAPVAAGLATFLPALAVGRYHVAQRVFREGLTFASASGIIAHALLVLGALCLAAASGLLIRRIHRSAGAAGLGVVAAALLALGAGIGSVTQHAEAAVARPLGSGGDAGRPNVILIVVDTLRADAVEPYSGAAEGSTPAFAALASDGVTFERAYAQASWTRPSIASILTAQYPFEHGAVHKMDFLAEGAVTLAEALRAQGYWTAGFVTNINVAPVFNFQQGFDEYVYLEPDFYFGATDSATKLAIYKGLRVVRERFFGGRMYFHHYYQDAEVLNRAALDWLEQQPPRPFFLLMHYMDPHDPFFEIPYNGRGVARVMTPSPAPEAAGELHDLYLQDVRYLDHHLGVFLQRLRSLGLYENSIIALVADHGEEFFEHGGWWHGTTLYEEALHVPMVIKRPGEPQAGQRRGLPVRTIDLAPTIMTAAELERPASFSGNDLFGEEAVEPIIAEEDLEGNRLASIRMGKWKLITANPGNPRGLARLELYDLQSDPREQRNLAEVERDQVQRLLTRLEEMRMPAGMRGSRHANRD